MKNIQKNKRNLLLFGGRNSNLGGEIPPLKALKKALGINYQGNCQMMQEMD